MLRIDSEGMDGGKKMEFSLSNDDDIENIEKWKNNEKWKKGAFEVDQTAD